MPGLSPKVDRTTTNLPVDFTRVNRLMHEHIIQVFFDHLLLGFTRQGQRGIEGFVWIAPVVQVVKLWEPSWRVESERENIPAKELLLVVVASNLEVVAARVETEAPRVVAWITDHCHLGQ